MVSPRAVRSALAVVLAVVALSGCAHPAPGAASTVDPSTAATATPSHPAGSASPLPSSSPTAGASTPGPSTPADPAAGLAAAARACQAIAGGFSAANVAAALAPAAEAARNDLIWQPLTDDLTFIANNPIDPNTGEGPQKTVDDASAVADLCFSKAGVQVSQD